MEGPCSSSPKSSSARSQRRSGVERGKDKDAVTVVAAVAVVVVVAVVVAVVAVQVAEAAVQCRCAYRGIHALPLVPAGYNPCQRLPRQQQVVGRRPFPRPGVALSSSGTCFRSWYGMYGVGGVRAFSVCSGKALSGFWQYLGSSYLYIC